VTVEFIGGRSPEIYFFNSENKEIESKAVHDMTFVQLHELLVSKGFEKKVPEEEAAASSSGATASA